MRMTSFRRAWLGALLALPLFGAAAEIRDDAGESVKVNDAPCRIVSLAPGTTAMLYAAGAGHCLIGTIAHSTEPEAAAKLPVIGDAETLDFEQLLALRPTVVVVAVVVAAAVSVEAVIPKPTAPNPPPPPPPPPPHAASKMAINTADVVLITFTHNTSQST
jgi:ABC-type hemin transport system substrate-binding protein